MRHLPQRLRGGVVAPEVRALPLISVAEEIELRVTRPHRLRIACVVVRHIFRRARVEVKEPHIRREPAAIAFPRCAVGVRHHVGKRPAVWRNCTELAVGNRQPLRHAALRVDFEKLPDPIRETLPPRCKDDALTVRPPAHHAIRRAVKSHAPWLAARDGHHVDVLVALVVSRERNLAAIRRKARPAFLAARRTQPQRRAPVLRREPDVARIGKRDVLPGNRRHPHQPRIE